MAFDVAVVGQAVLIILAGLIAAKIGKELRVPVPIPLLLTGYLLGVDVLNFLKPAEFGIDLSVVASIVVALVLFNEGVKTDPRNLRNMLRPVIAMTTIAVVVTVLGVASVLHFIFGFSWLTAFLIGAILSSTDPAAIVPVLKKLNISKRLSSVLEAEMALNDATAITLFLVIFGAVTGASISLGGAAGRFVEILAISSIVGVIIGWVFSELLKKLKIEHDLMFISIVVLLGAFSLGEYFGGSGVIAVVVAAIVFGSYLRSPRVESLSRLYAFNGWEEINFLAIAVIFLVLGSEISFAAAGPFILIGLVLALAFVYIVRPITVLLSLYFERGFTFREKLFISWVGSPRGTVSAALASIVVAKASQGFLPPAEAATIFNLTIIVVVATIVITSLTASKVTKWLLRISENNDEEKYRGLSVELRAMRVAKRQLQQEFKAGLIPPSTYRELSARHAALIRRHEQKLAEIGSKNPHLSERERIYLAKSMLSTEMNVLNEAFDNKELTETTYNKLYQKYNSLMSNLNVVEEQTKELALCKDNVCREETLQKFAAKVLAKKK